MEKVKNTVKVICFLLIMACLTSNLYEVLRGKDIWSKGISQFYDYPENTVDVTVMGSSHSYCTVNPALLWDKYGIAAVDMGEGDQNLGSAYYYMKEALKYQKPRVMLVELFYSTRRLLGVDNGHLYGNTINLRWSRNYIDNMKYAVSVEPFESEESQPGIEDIKEMEKYLFLKFPVFHSRYKEVTMADFYPAGAEQGAYVGAWTVEAHDVPQACQITESAELNAEQINWLDKMRELAEEHDVELVFFVAPYCLEADEMMQYNAEKEYAREYGIPFFNFNEIYEEIAFDYAADLRVDGRGGHLNNFGAEKVTNYLGEYLHSNYDLADHRNDGEKYAVYAAISKNWASNVASHNLEITDSFEAYMGQLDTKQYNIAAFLYNNQSSILESIRRVNPCMANALAANEVVYTTVGRRKNGIWKLSDRVILQQDQRGFHTLYIDKIEQSIIGADMVIVVVGKKYGELVNMGKFSYTEEGIIRIRE